MTVYSVNSLELSVLYTACTVSLSQYESELLTVGQSYGKMLAETRSFDVLFWYWVLGIGYWGIYIYTYVYIYIHIYISSFGYWGIYNMYKHIYIEMKQHMAQAMTQYQYA